MATNVIRVLLGALLAVFALAVPVLAQNVLPDPGNLTSYRASPGLVLTFTVIGNPSGSVWGTDTYTDDSKLATAAVHAGILGPGEQGNVTVEITGPQGGFTGSGRNGVTSSNYGSWDGSFRFVTDGATRTTTTIVAVPDPGNLTNYAANTGTQLTFTVTGSTSGSLWGDKIYTTDSSLARAAVHAGLLQLGETGQVTVEIMGPQGSFAGTEQNGVTSSSWGSYGSSFRFVETAALDDDLPGATPQMAGPNQARNAPPGQ